MRVAVICIAGLVIGAIFYPTSDTLTGVSSNNGSEANEGCPSVFKMTGASNERFCECFQILSNIN